MNRLIIIGNGFDLAHGFPTTYSDFLLWYLKSTIKKLESTRNSNIYYYNDGISSASYPSTIFQFKKEFEESSSIEEFKSRFKKLLGEGELTIKWKSKLFEDIIKLEERGWVDVENLYYEKLLDSVSPQFLNHPMEFSTDVIDLNRELTELKELLEEYLSSLDYSIKDSLKEKFESIFLAPSPSLDYLGIREVHGDGVSIMRTVFLDFNYTKTCKVYADELASQHIQIHGELNGIENPIIFGYGDEMDEKYKELENLNNNKVVEYFKSLGYHRTNRYRRLLHFMDEDEFEVMIVGHSCGLSDRTMLEAIFSQEHCKMIRLIHHGGIIGYNDIVSNISRHFKNKQELRRKLLHFKEQNNCPQHDDG